MLYLWAAKVVHVGCFHLSVSSCSFMCSHGCLCVGSRIQSWAVMVVWVMFILVGGHYLCVLIVKGGVVLGDGGAVVVVFPCHPGMWASVVLKVVVDVACTVYVCATSVVLWWHHLLGTTTVVVMIVVDIMGVVDVLVVVDVMVVAPYSYLCPKLRIKKERKKKEGK